MKKFYFTLWAIGLWFCAAAQTEKDSLKIIFTNDIGLVDPNYKQHLQTKNLFKENNYHKADYW